MNKYLMSEAVAKAIDLRGVEIIVKKNELSSLLSDLLPGYIYRVERMVLLQPLEVDEWRVLAETHDKSTDEHIRAINIIRPKLEDVLGWTQERCTLILECYISALGWDDINISELVDCSGQSVSQTAQSDSDDDFVSEIQEDDITEMPQSAPMDDTRRETVKFGTYKKKPMEWMILGKQGSNVLLMTRKTLTSVKYHKKMERTTWAECSLREYLNGEFFGTCFSSAERNAVILTHNTNPDTVYTLLSGNKIVTYGGEDTDDHVFLLSADELSWFFELTEVPIFESKLKKKAEKNLNDYPPTIMMSRDLCVSGFTSDWWWLRSLGCDSTNAAYIDLFGIVNIWGRPFYSTRGLRPVLWVREDAIL